MCKFAAPGHVPQKPRWVAFTSTCGGVKDSNRGQRHRHDLTISLIRIFRGARFPISVRTSRVAKDGSNVLMSACSNIRPQQMAAEGVFDAATSRLLQANELFLFILDHSERWPLDLLLRTDRLQYLHSDTKTLVERSMQLLLTRSKAVAHGYRETADLRGVYLVSSVGRLLVRCVFFQFSCGLTEEHRSVISLCAHRLPSIGRDTSSGIFSAQNQQ